MPNEKEKNTRISKYLKIGEKMKMFRSDKNISQKEMAKLLGFTAVSSYSNYENEYAEPTIEILQNFCKILNISLSDFFWDSKYNNVRVPISTYSDFLKDIIDLEKLGISFEFSSCNDTKDIWDLSSIIKIHDRKITTFISSYESLKEKLNNKLLTEKEYNLQIETLLQMFNVKISDGDY